MLDRLNPFKKLKTLEKQVEEAAKEKEVLQTQLAETTHVLKQIEAERKAKADAIAKKKAERERLQKLKEEEEARKSAKKRIATMNKEPYIDIVSVKVDPETPGGIAGEFEFDWNEYFIDELKKHGYDGTTEEQIVDQWFRNVCKHVYIETHEQSIADIGIVEPSKRDLGDGRTEYK